ncbi:cysteine desulfurase family protein [Agreia bicolorata]|nr:cysteine desulfurase family protein [Agreia bicolorata]
MPVYLDHAATTPMLPDARDAYIEALSVVGNPASIHSQGQQARRMLEEARENVAASVSADPVEVVFTSGGTESVNLGIKGLFWKRQEETPRRRILVPGGEHHATIDAVEWLAAHDGAEIEWLPIDSLGRLHPHTLREAIERDPESVALLSVLWANNEVGTIQPVAQLVAVAAEFDIPTHVDAISAFGYLSLDFHAAGAAAMSISAHKIGGPVGVGALLLSRSAEVVPLFHGGSQQRGRSGTQDVAGAVSFGVAARRASAEVVAHATELRVLRDRLVENLRLAVPEAVLQGDPDAAGRLPGNAHFTFPGCEGDSLLFLLDVAGLSVSTGSACQAGVPEASHVLTAMGLSEADARGALRMTLGHGTTEADVDALVEALPTAFAQASKAGLSDRVVPLGHAR